MSASNEESRYNRGWLEAVMKPGGKVELLAPLAAPIPYGRPVGAGDGDTYVAAAMPAQGLQLNDHEVATVVNETRRLALEYGGSQMLRDKLSAYLTPILRGERRP